MIMFSTFLQLIGQLIQTSFQIQFFFSCFVYLLLDTLFHSLIIIMCLLNYRLLMLDLSCQISILFAQLLLNLMNQIFRNLQLKFILQQLWITNSLHLLV